MSLRSCVFAFVLLAPSVARADTFQIMDASSMSLNVYTWAGRPCVVRPEPTDRSACRASDPTAAPAMNGPVDPLSFAVVHFDDWDMHVFGARVLSTPEIDDEESGAVLAVAKQAVRAALPATGRLVSDGIDEHTEVKRSNGARIVRVVPAIEMSLGSSPPARVTAVEYVVFAARGVYDFTFVADAARAADVAKVADNAMASLVTAPPTRARPNPIYVLSYWLGRLTMLGLVAFIVVSSVSWWRARERQRRASS